MSVQKDELGEYLFHQGTNYRAYDYLGAHKYGDKMIFRVWAPSALAVFLAGDFVRRKNPVFFGKNQHKFWVFAYIYWKGIPLAFRVK